MMHQDTLGTHSLMWTVQVLLYWLWSLDLSGVNTAPIEEVCTAYISAFAGQYLIIIYTNIIWTCQSKVFCVIKWNVIFFTYSPWNNYQVCHNHPHGMLIQRVIIWVIATPTQIYSNNYCQPDSHVLWQLLPPRLICTVTIIATLTHMYCDNYCHPTHVYCDNYCQPDSHVLLSPQFVCTVTNMATQTHRPLLCHPDS